VKPDPPAGVAELAVDDGKGKLEKLDSDTGIVADIQKCRVTKQTVAAGMESFLSLHLESSAWLTGRVLLSYSFYTDIRYSLCCTTRLRRRRGYQNRWFRDRVLGQRISGGVLERNFIIASDLALMSQMTSLGERLQWKNDQERT
jgi:hypothetical protein